MSPSSGAAREGRRGGYGTEGDVGRQRGGEGEKEEEGEDAVHLAVRALIEVVEPSSKTMEVAVVRAGDAGVQVMSQEDLDALVQAVEAKKAEEAPAAGAAGGAMQVDS